MLTFKNKKPWKYLSVGLLGVIAIGLISPVDAKPDEANSGWQFAVSEIQTQIDAVTGDFQNQINEINIQLESLSFVQDDPGETVLEIQLAPGSSAPAIAVKDENNNDLFTVNDDGSIKIGSNTVNINPDGTVTGSPLHLQAGSTVDGENISTGEHFFEVECPEGSSIRVLSQSAIICKTDFDTNTTYDGTDFATSGLSCEAGGFVTGISANGNPICSVDHGLPYTYLRTGSVSVPFLTPVSIDLKCNLQSDQVDTWYNSMSHSGMAQLGATPIIGPPGNQGVHFTYWNDNPLTGTANMMIQCSSSTYQLSD